MNITCTISEYKTSSINDLVDAINLKGATSNIKLNNLETKKEKAEIVITKGNPQFGNLLRRTLLSKVQCKALFVEQTKIKTDELKRLDDDIIRRISEIGLKQSTNNVTFKIDVVNNTKHSMIVTGAHIVPSKGKISDYLFNAAEAAIMELSSGKYLKISDIIVKTGTYSENAGAYNPVDTHTYSVQAVANTNLVDNCTIHLTFTQYTFISPMSDIIARFRNAIIAELDSCRNILQKYSDQILYDDKNLHVIKLQSSIEPNMFVFTFKNIYLSVTQAIAQQIYIDNLNIKYVMAVNDSYTNNESLVKINVENPKKYMINAIDKLINLCKMITVV